MAGDVVHQRADERAVPGQHGLHRDRPVVDPPHDLDLLLGQRLLRRALIPVGAGPDEERGLARVPVGHLHHQVMAQPGAVRQGQQLGVAGRPPEHVGDAGNAGVVAQLGGHYLGVEAVPERGCRVGDPQPGPGRQFLGLVVEHDEHRPAAGAVRCSEAEDLGVPEQVVADVLDGFELRGPPVLRHEHVRVAALERVEVRHIVEVPHPAVHAEQVERGGGDEVDGRLVGAEELPQVGDPVELRWRAAHSCLPPHGADMSGLPVAPVGHARRPARPIR